MSLGQDTTLLAQDLISSFLPILKKLNKIHKEMDEKDVQSEEKAKGGV